MNQGRSALPVPAQRVSASFKRDSPTETGKGLCWLFLHDAPDEPGHTEGLDHGRVEICPIQEFPATSPLLSNKFQQNSHSQKGKELLMDVASWEKLLLTRISN